MLRLSFKHLAATLRLLPLAAIWLLPAGALADEIRVIFPNQPGNRATLNTFYRGQVEYLNTAELAEAFSIRYYVNNAVQKQVLHFREGEVKVTAFSSFVIIDDKSYQLPAPSYFDGRDFYLPARSFFRILGSTVLKGATFDESRRAFIGPRSLLGYNIHRASVEEKRNGTLIRVRTSQTFDAANIVRYITDNGWLVVQIPAGKVDTLELARSTMGGLIRNAWGRQLANSAELRFKLNEKVPLPEVFQVDNGRELHIALRNPVRKKGNRTEEMRKLWYLNTIVIDAGHGGKDAGTTGRGGLQEKTVCLDVALRLGKLLKRRTKMKVVYTRDEDVFVPLFQRTKIANEAGGKLFISIHVNGVKNRGARGFETWLLAPANTPEAIEIAQRENSVIALEESNHRYREFTDETLILSTMAQSVWMKESETLAAQVQQELAARLDSPNRGVKQADFYVLIGATMPNVLVEIGFLSNRIEEKKLGQSEYRQRISEGIYNAILKFKKQQEQAMASNQ